MRRGITITLAALLLVIAGTDTYAQSPFYFNQSDPRIIDINVTGPTTVREEAVLDVIPVKTGDIYSPNVVDGARKYLERWGLFEDIDIDVSKSGDGVVLTIRLVDATIVAQIDITGNYPYIENKVRKYLTLHAGDAYTPERVEEQIQRLSDFYTREGYVGTEIAVDEEEGPAPKTILLTFKIHHGKLLRYRTITIEGNRAYPDGRFISTINTYMHYSEKRLRKSLRKLRTFYHMHGYPRAKIRVTSKSIDLDNNRVDITIGVKEGPYIDARFVGNDSVNTATLRKTITIFREGSFDSYEIEESVKAIDAYYRKRGFPNIKTTAHRTKISEDYIIISFEIEEGQSRYIRKVIIEGNELVPSKKLTKGMLTKKHALGRPGALLEENVPRDSERIVNELKKEGYLDARVESWKIEPTPQGYGYDVTIPIDEGPQIVVESTTFTGNHAISDDKLSKKLKLENGKPLNPFLTEGDRQRLKLYYADSGHPYAKVAQDISFDDANDSARINYTIEEGSEVTVGYILIVGDVLTSQKAIKNAMDLKTGDQFSYQKLVESQLNIRRLGAFSSVKIETIGIEEKQTTVHLKVSVDEERPFRIDLELGYSTSDSLIGSLLFTNINSFGWAKKTFLKLTAGKKLSRVELGWRDPLFLSSSFEMSVISWLQHRVRPSYNYVQLGGTLGFYRRLDRLGVLFLQEFTRNYFIEGDSVAADDDSLRNNTISRTSMSASYDARDSFSNPTKGYYGLGKIDFFNEIRGDKAHFVKFTVQAEYDYSPAKRLVFSSAGRFDDIETIGSGVSIPTNELLFMGGADTVRGYAEDSLGPLDAQGRATGGRIRWIINEELRLRLFKSLQLAGFFDVGSLTNNFSSIGTGTVRMSAGVGIRYLTPVGPLRLDWGFPINRRPQDSKSRVHFTFGYVF